MVVILGEFVTLQGRSLASSPSGSCLVEFLALRRRMVYQPCLTPLVKGAWGCRCGDHLEEMSVKRCELETLVDFVMFGRAAEQLEDYVYYCGTASLFLLVERNPLES